MDFKKLHSLTSLLSWKQKIGLILSNPNSSDFQHHDILQISRMNVISHFLSFSFEQVSKGKS